MTSKCSRSALAIGLVLSMASLTASPLMAAGTAKFSGRVVLEDGITPRADVVIILAGTNEDQTFRSDPTGEEGSFTFDTAPPGSYTLLAETDEGLFLAVENLVLVAGENRPLMLALQPQDPADVLSPSGLAQNSGGLPRWAEYVIAGAIVVIAFVLFDDASENPEEGASDFNMGTPN